MISDQRSTTATICAHVCHHTTLQKVIHDGMDYRGLNAKHAFSGRYESWIIAFSTQPLSLIICPINYSIYTNEQVRV